MSVNNLPFSFCRNHEWFKKDLPEDLFPLVNENEASVIDADAVQEVCNVSITNHYLAQYVLHTM